jgi:hypothetical protein
MESSDWHHLRYYPGIRLKELLNITKNIIQDTRRPGGDSNRVSSEYNSEALPLERTCSVRVCSEKCRIM